MSLRAQAIALVGTWIVTLPAAVILSLYYKIMRGGLMGGPNYSGVPVLLVVLGLGVLLTAMLARTGAQLAWIVALVLLTFIACPAAASSGVLFYLPFVVSALFAAIPVFADVKPKIIRPLMWVLVAVGAVLTIGLVLNARFGFGPIGYPSIGVELFELRPY